MRDEFSAAVRALRIGPLDGQNALMTTQDLEKIAGLTLEHYNRHAEDFQEGTQRQRRADSPEDHVNLVGCTVIR